jgi:hypothetical protein
MTTAPPPEPGGRPKEPGQASLLQPSAGVDSDLRVSTAALVADSLAIDTQGKGSALAEGEPARLEREPLTPRVDFSSAVEADRE